MSRLHRVLADSDDDDEDAIYAESAEVSQSSRDEPPMVKLDGTEGRSTGSTERPCDEDHYTELGLFMGPGGGAIALPIDVCNIDSPTSLQSKRRYTVMEHDTHSQIEEPQSKRVKTSPVWSTKADPTTFEVGQPLSTSMHTTLSTTGPDVTHPVGISDGAIRAAFVNHDPAMFRDTGSTIPDNSTSQRRMIEQAQNEIKMPGASATYTALKTDEKSSSFPWPSSRGTEHISDDKFEQPDTVPIPSQGSLGLTKQGLANTDRVYDDEDDSITCIDVTSNNSSSRNQKHSRIANHPRRQTSPRVEIPPPCSSVNVETTTTTPNTQQSTKSRRRRTQKDESDTSRWDELAIGLPKERYIPRPSNRRSTNHVIEVVDFSIAPEKAAKAARAKSMGGTSDPKSSSRGKHQGQPPAVIDLESNKAQSPATSPRIGNEATKTSHVVEDSILLTTEAFAIPLPARNHADFGPPNHSSLQSPSDQLSLTAEKQDHTPSVQTPQLQNSRGISSENLRVNASSKSKSRRSHTTIFEDHIDFNGCNISPSLVQQQAHRKSALQDVHNETPGPGRRKRRAVIEDDEDNDHDDYDEEPIKSAKSKAKGHKSQVKAQGKLSSKDSYVHTNASLATLGELENGNGDEEVSASVSSVKTSQTQAQAQPAARTRKGRADSQETSLKVVKEQLLKDAQTQAENVVEDDLEPGSASIPEQTDVTSSELRGTNNHDSRFTTPLSASKGLANTKDITTPDQHQAKAPLHSPIKSSSGVPLRVGLSKRSRIQPLLRILKPLKK